jgi:hypothetical protein
VAPQVLNAAKTACVAPTPVCVAPQVLNATSTACITPTLVCVAPQVLNAAQTACVTPIPVCMAPQVLNAAKTACITPTPVCVAPQVLNATSTACITPTPVCVAPQVLNATTNTCETPVSSNNCSKYASNDDENDDEEHDSSKIIPTITGPSLPVSVHAGETLKVAFTAVDCADRPITIVQAAALPAGATIVNSIDTELHLAKAVVTWVVPARTKAQTLTITLKAVVTDNGKTISSAPQSVSVKVLAASEDTIVVTDGIVLKNTLANARYNAKTHKLEISGRVLWSTTSTVAQRTAVLKAEPAVVKNAANRAFLGTAVVSINGTWTSYIPLNAASVPCSIDVSFHGKTGVKVVSGVCAKICIK